MSMAAERAIVNSHARTEPRVGVIGGPLGRGQHNSA